MVTAIAFAAIAASCSSNPCRTVTGDVALDEAVGHDTKLEALRASGVASELGVPAGATLADDGRTILDDGLDVGTAGFLELENGNFVAHSITYCG